MFCCGSSVDLKEFDTLEEAMSARDEWNNGQPTEADHEPTSPPLHNRSALMFASNTSSVQATIELGDLS